MDGYIGACLDPFGADGSVVVRAAPAPRPSPPGIAAIPHGAAGIGAAPARRDGDAPAADSDTRLCLDAVLPGSDVKGAPLDDDDPPLSILIVVRLESVAGGVHGDRPTRNPQRVSTADAIADRIYHDRAAGDGEVVLAGQSVVIPGVDGQRPAAADGKVVLAKEGGVGLIGAGVVIDIGLAVGQVVLRTIGQDDDDLLGILHVNGRAGGAGDIHPGQHEGYRPLVPRIHNYPAVSQRAAEPVGAAGGDGHSAAAH